MMKQLKIEKDKQNEKTIINDVRNIFRFKKKNR